MTRHGILRTAREVFLTLGAVLGVVCIVVTVAGFAFGVKPLIFRSGSMSPAIHTGDMSISRTVEASALKRGDIVSVVNSGGERVTHRLVNAARQGDARQLTLKGDANKKADKEVYTVTSAERVLFTIPKAGYAVNFATSTVGIFILGLYVAGMLTLVFRRTRSPGGPDDRPPVGRRGGARKAPGRASRARSVSRSMVIAAFGASVVIASPAVAVAWTDTVPVTGSTFQTLTVLAPTGTVTCANGAAGSGTVLLSWTPSGNPVTTAQRYKVVVINDNSIFNTNDIFFSTVVSTGTFTLPRDQLNLPALYSGNPSVRIYGSLPNGGWETIGFITRTIRIDWGTASIRCS
jgi:signal peptidase I